MRVAEPPRPGVAEVQRARLVGAMIWVCAERGAANVSVSAVVGRAGVSRRTFYELFEDREDCFVAAFDEGVRRIARRAAAAYGRPGRVRARLRAGLVELLGVLDDDPRVGRLVVVEALAAGSRALGRRGQVLGQLAGTVEGLAGEARDRALPSPLVAEGVVGAAAALVHARMLEGAARPLLELTGPLMSMIVLPYLGLAAARRELALPAPSRPGRRRARGGHPLDGIPTRVTYRTMRVLDAIARHPGASNRRVGDVAGIVDQGQISKLLTRLTRVGLIENGRDGRMQGAPNAWRLTEQGEDVHDAFASRAGP